MKNNKLSPDQIKDIQRRILNGEFQHDIAALYGLNQGRISEMKQRMMSDQKEGQLFLFI